MKKNGIISVCSTLLTVALTVFCVYSSRVAAQTKPLPAATAATNVAAGVYRLRNQCSAKLLEVTGSSLNTGALLAQSSDTGGLNQQFKLEATDSGYFKLTAQHSGLVVDVKYAGTANGTPIWQWTNNGTNAQQWQAIDVGNGYYKLESRVQASKVLDVNGASTANGAKVQLWTANGTCAQAWKLEQVNAAAGNALLARTINFGNALEASNEGEWGMTLEERYFQLVKDAGFTAIRLPVKFSAHASATAPYTLDATFMQRVDWAINQATSRGLAIIVDMHHYDELITDPAANRDRFLAMWRQIAERYRNQPANVFFEILNEPNGAIELVWNEYAAAALQTIRQTNPTRYVIVGPGSWNSAEQLYKLQLPSDSNLIVTIHHYTPFRFTHQGAEWANPIPPVGVVWPQSVTVLNSPWENWSWDTTLNFLDNSFEITHRKQWAGLYLHQNQGATGFAGLRIRTNRAVSLQIKCLEQNPGGTGQNADVTTQANQTLDIPAATCGNSNGVLRDLMILNPLAGAQPPFIINQLEIYNSSGATTSLIGNAQSEARSPLEVAREWAALNNRPIFVGEFGAYSKADMDSRVRWTTFVRSESERIGFSWAYWEFGAGFGIYDRSTNQWRTPLLQALIPGANP